MIFFNDHLKKRKIVVMNESENKEKTHSVGDAHSNLSRETVFHAVYIPRDNEDSVDTCEFLHIYQDMPDALKIIKEHKKARLKTFKNRSDAEAYIRTGQIQSYGSHSAVISTSIVAQEKSGNFKTLRPQDCVSFRKLIESGDIDSVRSAVWENPRYLIGSGDTPAILQIGYRYNAMHIAVKSNKPEMCELILKTVRNPTFIQLYYGDECKSCVDSAGIMLDLYLNTPDKGLYETPLHFATKYGFKDIVRILVSYSQCDKSLPNKYKQLPIDIICTRKCQKDTDLKQEIRMLLEDHFYVPVLRAEDNTCQPTIGEPFSPTSPVVNSFIKDPISPRLEVRAFAGPMTKSQAFEFRKKWKTPPRAIITSAKKEQGDACSIMNSPIANITLRLQDTEKGLERVGRDLAKEYQVPWKEYWPFLKDFVDFRNDEGLAKLEKYLEQKFKDYKDQLIYSIMRNLSSNVNTEAPEKYSPMLERPTEKSNTLDVSEIQDLCDKLRSCSINADNESEENSDDLEFFTPPSSPELIHDDSDDDMQNAEEEGSIIFIEGSSSTKLDYAVYNALSSVIDPDMYPYIYRWRHDIQLAVQRDPCRFDTKSLRRKLFTNI